MKIKIKIKDIEVEYDSPVFQYKVAKFLIKNMEKAQKQPKKKEKAAF